jgi:hypothetical protein
MVNILQCMAAAAVLCVSANAQDAALLRDGDYLSTAYLAALDKTKSHHKAGEVPAPQMITVSRENGDITYGAISNWHEGGGGAIRAAWRRAPYFFGQTVNAGCCTAVKRPRRYGSLM